MKIVRLFEGWNREFMPQVVDDNLTEAEAKELLERWRIEDGGKYETPFSYRCPDGSVFKIES